MTGTIVVGVIISLMFLVSFTEWFYHIAAGVNEVAVRDLFFFYRIGGWIVGGILFIGGVFWILALTNECPVVGRERVGIFRYLNCDVYWEMRSFVEGKSVPLLMEEAANKSPKLDDK